MSTVEYSSIAPRHDPHDLVGVSLPGWSGKNLDTLAICCSASRDDIQCVVSTPALGLVTAVLRAILCTRLQIKFVAAGSPFTPHQIARAMIG